MAMLPVLIAALNVIVCNVVFIIIFTLRNVHCVNMRYVL